MLIPIEPKYAVDTYSRKIVNRQSNRPLHDQEPVVVFRAQDARLPAVLATYLLDCTDRHHRLAIALRLVQVLEWQVLNPDKVKEPDTVIDSNWRSSSEDK